MCSLRFLVVLCTLIQWETKSVHGWRFLPDFYSLRYWNATNWDVLHGIQPLAGPYTRGVNSRQISQGQPRVFPVKYLFGEADTAYNYLLLEEG